MQINFKLQCTFGAAHYSVSVILEGTSLVLDTKFYTDEAASTRKDSYRMTLLM